jgi:hypothetical protein
MWLIARAPICWRSYALLKKPDTPATLTAMRVMPMQASTARTTLGTSLRWSIARQVSLPVSKSRPIAPRTISAPGTRRVMPKVATPPENAASAIAVVVLMLLRLKSFDQAMVGLPGIRGAVIRAGPGSGGRTETRRSKPTVRDGVCRRLSGAKLEGPALCGRIRLQRSLTGGICRRVQWKTQPALFLAETTTGSVIAPVLLRDTTRGSGRCVKLKRPKWAPGRRP